MLYELFAALILFLVFTKNNNDIDLFMSWWSVYYGIILIIFLFIKMYCNNNIKLI